MRIILVSAAAIIATVVPALFAPAIAMAPAASAATAPVIYDGFTSWSKPTVKPQYIYVLVMSDTIGKNAWSTWTGTYAKGAGWQTTNNCKPSCANGHVTWYRVWLTLSQVRHHGSRAYFSRMAVVRANGTKTQIYRYNKTGLRVWLWH